MSNIHAVIKATYTKSQAKAKASVRYFSHRLDREAKRITREIFGSYGPLTKAQAYRMIDQTRGQAYFYRIVISPKHTGEEIDLKRITRETILRLQGILNSSRELSFIAVAHTDHSNTPHVHTLVVLRTYLTDATLTKLREACEAVVLTGYPEREAQKAYGYTSITTGGSPLMLRARYLRWQAYSMSELQDRFCNASFTAAGPRNGGGRSAGHPGRKLFICPGCNQPSKLKKTDDYFECRRCGMEIGRRSNRFLFAEREGGES